MNARVKELAKQAGWNGFDVLDERNQKFAELLVLECARIADKAWAAPGYQIKQHFGVEK